MFRSFVFIGFIASLFLISPAFGQGKPGPSSEKEVVKKVVRDKAFSRDEVGIIADILGIVLGGEEIYTDQHGRAKGKTKGKGRGDGLPPGLAKRSQLPPGLAKMKTLPPGLSKSPLPYDLKSLLPPPPPGTQRFIVGGTNVVLIDQGTGRVVDIIKGKVDRNKLAEVEKRSAETLRRKGRGGEAADGNLDRPVITGNVPNSGKKDKKQKKKKK